MAPSKIQIDVSHSAVADTQWKVNAEVELKFLVPKVTVFGFRKETDPTLPLYLSFSANFLTLPPGCCSEKDASLPHTSLNLLSNLPANCIGLK